MRSHHLTKKTKSVKSEYTLHGVILATVITTKYLGDNINNTLSWNDHTNAITKRGSQSLNFVRRNFSSWPASIYEQCYMSLVRPQLEYASSVWDNSSKLNITKNRIRSANCSRICVPQLRVHIKCNDYATESRLGISSTALSLQQSSDAVSHRERSCCNSSNNLSTASASLHQRSWNTIRASALQFQHVWTDFVSVCHPDVQFSAHWGLPTVVWQFQGPVVRHHTCVTHHPVFILHLCTDFMSSLCCCFTCRYHLNTATFPAKTSSSTCTTRHNIAQLWVGAFTNWKNYVPKNWGLYVVDILCPHNSRVAPSSEYACIKYTCNKLTLKLTFI